MMNMMLSLYAKYRAHIGGATSVEYGLIIALMVVAIIGGVTALSETNSNNFNTASDSFSGG